MYVAVLDVAVPPLSVRPRFVVSVMPKIRVPPCERQRDLVDPRARADGHRRRRRPDPVDVVNGVPPDPPNRSLARSVPASDQENRAAIG